MQVNSRSAQASLEKKLYGLVIARLDGDLSGHDSHGEKILELIAKGIGGILLEGGEKDLVGPFVARARSRAEGPLFIASRVDRGVGARLKGATRFPGPLAFAAALGGDGSANMALLRRALTAMALEAADCGVTVPLMAGTTTETSPDSPIERIAAEHGKAFRSAGLPLWKTEQASATSSVHVLSSPDGEEEMRVGVPVTDASNPLDLMADGADVLVAPGDGEAFVQSLVHHFPASGIQEATIDAALAKVARAQSRLKGEAPHSSAAVDYSANEALAGEIAQRAITLVRGRGKFLPVRDAAGLPLIYSGAMEHFLGSHLRFYVSQASHETRPLPAHERPITLLLFGGGENGAEQSGPDRWERLARLMKGVSPAIVVSFGDPLELHRFKGAHALIAAYDPSPEAQEAVFRCITGERGFEGRLPVEFPLSAKERRAAAP